MGAGTGLLDFLAAGAQGTDAVGLGRARQARFMQNPARNRRCKGTVEPPPLFGEEIGWQNKSRWVGRGHGFHELSQVLGALGRAMILVRTKARWPQCGQTNGGDSTCLRLSATCFCSSGRAGLWGKSARA